MWDFNPPGYEKGVSTQPEIDDISLGSVFLWYPWKTHKTQIVSRAMIVHIHDYTRTNAHTARECVWFPFWYNMLFSEVVQSNKTRCYIEHEFDSDFLWSITPQTVTLPKQNELNINKSTRETYEKFNDVLRSEEFRKNIWKEKTE